MAGSGENPMKAMPWVVITLLAATALAGCTGQPPGGGTTGNPTSVSVTRTPDNAPPNTQQVVCWRVEGSGTIPHTAIHTDTTSHPGSGSFSDYAGTTYYPNNASSASNVNIPGEFCTAVAVGTQDLYFRAHAMQAAPGVISPERRIAVRESTAVIAAVTVGQHNQTAPASAVALVCWSVTGTGSIPHTALHTDTTRHPTATSFSDYKGDAFYPNNRTSADTQGYALPGSFCTNVRMPTNGTLYFRAHAMVNPPGMMSAESSIAVNGSTAFTGTVATVTWDSTHPVPANAPGGSNVTVCIRVGGTGRVPHVAVHTDSESHATDLTATFGTYDGPAYYPANQTAVNSSGYDTGGQVHCTNVRVPTGLGSVVYLRGHAMDAIIGAPGRLTPDEKQIAAS